MDNNYVLFHQFRNVVVAEDGSLSGEEYHYYTDKWGKFSADRKLLHIRLAIDAYPDCCTDIWQLQDGYGAPGSTPTQGWDGSGIRDSTPAAIDRMYEVAKKYFTEEEFTATVFDK